jgi:hypothetical protein
VLLVLDSFPALRDYRQPRRNCRLGGILVLCADGWIARENFTMSMHHISVEAVPVLPDGRTLARRLDQIGTIAAVVAGLLMAIPVVITHRLDVLVPLIWSGVAVGGVAGLCKGIALRLTSK